MEINLDMARDKYQLISETLKKTNKPYEYFNTM